MSQAEPTVESVRRKAESLCIPYTVDIERRMIKKFVAAVGDANPLWNNETAASKSEYGGTIMPPTFFCAGIMAGLPLTPDMLPPLSTAIDMGSNWQFFLPVRVGDIVQVTPEIADIKDRQGKLGHMFFIYFNTCYYNQRGELVAQAENTVMYY